MQGWIVTKGEAGQSLQEFLVRHTRLTRNGAKRLLDQRLVFVNRQRVWMARHPLRAGDVVEAPPAMSAPAVRREAQTLTVIHEEAACLVVNKPAGLLADGPGSIEEQLQQQRNEPGIRSVHRLDRDTTGCLLLARNAAEHARLVGCFEAQQVHKTYLLLATGSCKPGTFRVSVPLDGLSAVTDFRVLDIRRGCALLEARPETGRTHQIRLHLRAVGLTLAGDRQYAGAAVEDDRLLQLPHHLLHAASLAWPGSSGDLVRARAPAPRALVDTARALGLSLAPTRGGGT